MKKTHEELDQLPYEEYSRYIFDPRRPFDRSDFVATLDRIGVHHLRYATWKLDNPIIMKVRI